MKHAAKLPSRATTAASGVPAHRLSHAIAKAPPRKIRIVHVLAPEIIKTEARHFRELVQRLTGKPAPNGAAAASHEDTSPSGSCDTASEESRGAGSAAAVIRAEVKEEAETSSSSGGGGYLQALGMDDGSNELYFQGLEDLLFSPCNMDGFSF